MMYDKRSVSTAQTSLQRVDSGQPAKVSDPAAAPTLVIVASSGNLTAGVYQYKYSLLTRAGETKPSPAGSVTASSGHLQTTVTVPVAPTEEGGAEVIGRKVYRTAHDGTSFTLVTTILDNTTTTFTDNVADSTISATASPAAVNATGYNILPCSMVSLSADDATKKILNPDGTQVTIALLGSILHRISLGYELIGGSATVLYWY